jgi:hypothetical protein
MKAKPPDALELLAFFETEPTLLDPGAPWIHNTATYETEHDGYSVRFEISPSYSTLKVTVAAAGREVAQAEVTAFTSLEISTDRGKETLIARFGESAASALFLSVRPNVRLSVVASSDS